jgi:hypothetical protein
VMKCLQEDEMVGCAQWQEKPGMRAGWIATSHI